MRLRSLCPAVVALLGVSVTPACSAGGGGSEAPDGLQGPNVTAPSVATGNPTQPPGDVGGLPGDDAPINPIDLGSNLPDPMVCNQVQISFEPQTPTVMVLLDRSSSMFEQVVGTTTLWETVKQAIYEVMGPLQGTLRFGFVSYTGLQDGAVPPSGLPTQNIPPTTSTANCPLFSPQAPITPALDNLAAIQTVYDGLADPTASPPNVKGETPTGIAYEQTVQQLLAFSEPGPKFVILITDGVPDFCNDTVCAEDHAVASVQEAFAAGIRTIVFGLGTATSTHLQDLANAGVGMPVRWPATTLFCAGDMGVPADTATRLLGTYAAPAEITPNAPFYFSANADALTTELGAQIAGVKSCVFDLEGQVEIDINQGSDGTVKLCDITTCDATAAGNTLTFADPNGWRLNTSTQLELTGAACTTLQAQTTQGIFIDFPCDAIILR